MAMQNKNMPEMVEPTLPPSASSWGIRLDTVAAAMAIATDNATTMVEWPRAKK